MLAAVFLHFWFCSFQLWLLKTKTYGKWWFAFASFAQSEQIKENLLQNMSDFKPLRDSGLERFWRFWGWQWFLLVPLTSQIHYSDNRSWMVLLLSSGQEVSKGLQNQQGYGNWLLEGNWKGAIYKVWFHSDWDEEDSGVLQRPCSQRGENRLGDAWILC